MSDMDSGLRTQDSGKEGGRRKAEGGRQGALALEYGALIVIVAAALLAMSVYMMRALNGRWKQVGDTFGYGRQYEPGLTH